jgi:hypothetical protein
MPCRTLLSLLLLLATTAHAFEAADPISGEPDGGGVPPQIEHVRLISNGTGLYCRGCSAIVEAVHDQLMATRHRWNEPGFTIRTKDYLEEFCAASKARPDEENVASSCSFLSNSYAGIIGSRHFGRSVPSESGLYVRTSRVCIDELGMCYSPEEPPAALTGKKGARCAAIATLLADLHDVYTRWDVTKQEMKALLPHARKVVEGACPQLARRFPPGRALKRLEEECDALVEEHEQALVLYLTASQPGGGDLEPMAQLTKCDLASAPVWRSPWATRSAVGAAREAVENNATAPSELVKRLTQLTQDRVFDAELDPEGWGRKEEGAAAAAAAPTAAKGKKSKKKKKKGASRDEL